MPFLPNTIEECHRVILEQALRIRELEDRIARLEERLNMNSSNSSQPPSKDSPYQDKAKRHGRPSGLKIGGQPGHAGNHRLLLPESEVDEIISCKPEGQCDCGGRVVIDRERAPFRQQQLELPPIKPLVKEFQRYVGVCKTCGKTHIGDLPVGVAPGILSHRLMSMVGVLSSKFHMSKRNTQDLLRDFFEVSVSLGTVSNTEHPVAESVKSSVSSAIDFVRDQTHVNMDETMHHYGTQRYWLWVAVTEKVSVFFVRSNRSTKIAVEILQRNFAGILGSDQFSAYTWLPPSRRQLCWSHVLRRFVAMSERDGQAGEIGKALLAQTHDMFHRWHQLRDGTLTRKEFRKQMVPVKQLIETLLDEGYRCGESKTENSCKRLSNLHHALWNFVDHLGVEPTNNAAERALRPYVIWRKCSYGTQSERGNHFVERMTTVVQTCKQQGRNVLDFMTQALEAHYAGTQAPSLLPA